MARISGIKVIAFDTDGTVVDFIKVMRHSQECALHELEKHRAGACTEMTVERMIEIRDAVMNPSEGGVVDLRAGRLESFRQIVALTGGPDESLAYRLFELYMKHRYEDIEVYEDVIPVLDRLKRKYKLGLHSNGNSYPELCGLDGYFDFTVFSEECGFKKPDPDFYRVVLERAGCSAGELLNIGDSLHNDIKAAASAGIKGIWLNRSQTKGPSETGAEYEVYSLSELPGLLCPDIDPQESRE